MPDYVGLTWDHPRGYNALAAAALRPELAASGMNITWEKQPLEGFESHPIRELCDRYDLVVLDHPHIGEAVAAGCLIALEEVFDSDSISELSNATIGSCLRSYRSGARHWALPLDAAAQVMAGRADLLETEFPETWDKVLSLSRSSGKVVLSTAGPHALLTFSSIITAFGEPPAESDPDRFIDRHAGAHALDLMSELIGLGPPSAQMLNPIGILAHMAERDDIALCPLIFGYVNYAAPKSRHAIRFENAPRAATGGRPGSVLGGTGIGISRRCAVTSQLKNHLLWLMSEEAQVSFIPLHDGQPSRRDAWNDEAINRRYGGFYRATAETLEQAHVRPRHAGYVAFQSQASQALRQALIDATPQHQTIDLLNTLYRQNHTEHDRRDLA